MRIPLLNERVRLTSAREIMYESKVSLLPRIEGHLGFSIRSIFLHTSRYIYGKSIFFPIPRLHLENNEQVLPVRFLHLLFLLLFFKSFFIFQLVPLDVHLNVIIL